MTIKELSQELSVSEQALRSWCKRNGVRKESESESKGKKAGYFLTENDIEQIRKHYSRKGNERKDTEKGKESENNQTLDILKAAIETLTAQLAEKDKQISEKDKQIAEKDKQISALSEQNANLTTTLNQQQALHAGTIQSMLMQQQKEPASPDIVKPQPTEQASAEPEQQPQKEPAEDPPPQKLSFFQRLFRKRSE